MFGMYEKDKRSIEKLDSPHIFGDHHLLNSYSVVPKFTPRCLSHARPFCMYTHGVCGVIN